MKAIRTSNGRPYPLGAAVTEEGTNFALFSRDGVAVYLELFDTPDDHRPRCSLQLDPRRNRTGDIWHLFVHGVGDGQLYGYRVDGPYSPAEDGHRFNVHKLLTDPYARAVAGTYNTEHDAVYGFDRGSDQADLSFNSDDSAPHTVKCVAMASTPFDWQGDHPPRVHLDDSIIYEMHVKGFSVDPSAGVSHPGSYLGVIDKIPHLQQLGVTAVELLPVHHFFPRELVGFDPEGKPLGNYWGYSTLGFFALQRAYAVGDAPMSEVAEFRQMVMALHRAGIEVILDVVFNHTGEGDQNGPTLSFRGLDNAVYYMLDQPPRRYKNYSGCGNTVNCNHPVVKQLILDSLRYWVVEMHVDGFRFDLATILGRNRKGEWIGNLGLLYDIGGDPILRGCKLIAESWDAEGMYKVGGFPSGWAEWNGRFRDDVRRFVRGDRGMITELARRIGGSHDLFGKKNTPAHSVNFITAHDGFTLRDLVSYNDKHNERNGEQNRDGSPANFSDNCGVEGETADPKIRTMRRQQAKNLLTILMLSRGTPMVLAGDELWSTKGGNNNTYCQDNSTSWLDWSGGEEAEALHRFTRMLVAFRRRHAALRRPCFVDPFAVDGAGVVGPVGSEIRWHGVDLERPDWSYHSHSLALQIAAKAPRNAPGTDDCEIYAAFNAWSKSLEFTLPKLRRKASWRRVIDTSLTSPDDIVEEQDAPTLGSAVYQVRANSAVVLVSV